MHPSDLTDEQWQVLEPALVAAQRSNRGRPVGIGRRRIIDAILYLTKTGCQWRQLPSEFGPWMTVYSHHRRMRQRGTWDRVLKTLREATREAVGRTAEPSVAILDSQSVKTTLKGGSATMTPARRSKVASGILPLIHRASCSL